MAKMMTAAVWCRSCDLWRHDIDPGGACPNCGMPMLPEEPDRWEGMHIPRIGDATIWIGVRVDPADRPVWERLESVADTAASGCVIHVRGGIWTGAAVSTHDGFWTAVVGRDDKTAIVLWSDDAPRGGDGLAPAAIFDRDDRAVWEMVRHLHARR